MRSSAALSPCIRATRVCAGTEQQYYLFIMFIISRMNKKEKEKEEERRIERASEDIGRTMRWPTGASLGVGHATCHSRSCVNANVQQARSHSQPMHDARAKAKFRIWRGGRSRPSLFAHIHAHNVLVNTAYITYRREHTMSSAVFTSLCIIQCDGVAKIHIFTETDCANKVAEDETKGQRYVKSNASFGHTVL